MEEAWGQSLWTMGITCQYLSCWLESWFCWNRLSWGQANHEDLLNRTSTFQNFPLLFIAGCQKHSDKSQDITSVRKKDFFCFWERKIFNYSVSTDLILKWICKFYQWSQIQWKKRLISLFQYTMHADMLSICAKQSIHSLVCLFFHIFIYWTNFTKYIHCTRSYGWY